MSTYPDLRLFIGGEWRRSQSTIDVINPSTEQTIGQLPVATMGFDVWRATAPAERAAVIRRAAALLRERQDEIATAITMEHGKPYRQAQLEVIRGAEFFEWDAGEAVRTYGRVIPSGPGIRYVVHHQPIGPVAAFAPWNFPMSQPARKVAGALASGCSIILKAAEETPAGAIHIAKAFQDAGLPDGVLQRMAPAKLPLESGPTRRSVEPGVWRSRAHLGSPHPPRGDQARGVYGIDGGRTPSDNACGQSHDPRTDGARGSRAGHRV